MTKNTTKETPKPVTQASVPLLDSLEHLTGKLAIKATNDYMFRAVLQSNEKALKGLLSALLAISIEEMVEVTILNPIQLGDAIDEKTIVLDLNVLLNNGKIINLEMQVLNKGDWPERSLYYLCKNFARLKHGQTDKDASISEFTFTLHEMTEDEKIYQQCLARERYERDQASLLAYGVEQGIEQGREQLNRLNTFLIEANRFDDLKRSTTDPAYQEQLLKEFNL